MCVCLRVPLFDRPPHHLLMSPQLPLQRMCAFVCISVYVKQRMWWTQVGSRHANTCTTTPMCIISRTAAQFRQHNNTQTALLTLFHCVGVASLSQHLYPQLLSLIRLYSKGPYTHTNTHPRLSHFTETCPWMHENTHSFWKPRRKHLSGSGVFLTANQRVVGREQRRHLSGLLLWPWIEMNVC